MKESKQLAIWFITLIFILPACREDVITDPFDTSGIRPKDIQEINEYILSKGYTQVDTTASGVRYVVLDSGSGQQLEYGDIVGIRYVGKFTNDTIFDTNVPSIRRSGEDSATFAARTNPLIRFTLAPVLVGVSLIQGMEDGLAAVCPHMKVGGKAEIMIPSDQGYGTSGGGAIPPNTVLVFEIYPESVRK